jgi:RNA binding exosome subunit
MNSLEKVIASIKKTLPEIPMAIHIDMLRLKGGFGNGD